MNTQINSTQNYYKFVWQQQKITQSKRRQQQSINIDQQGRVGVYQKLQVQQSDIQIKERQQGNTTSLDNENNIFYQLQNKKTFEEKLKYVIEQGKQLPMLPPEDKNTQNRVLGCTSQVWVSVNKDDQGVLHFSGDSTSQVTRGITSILIKLVSGFNSDQILELEISQDIEKVASQLEIQLRTPARNNTFLNVWEAMKKRVRSLNDQVPLFPSLLVTKKDFIPQGAFAEAQARYLKPSPQGVQQLTQLLKDKKIGVVAHFYMDPEVQGILTQCMAHYPHIQISDSLQMADAAVKMAQEGCRHIAVLGVDFMSENVRAILSEQGYKDVDVLRMSHEVIGCSLAEAAESPQYFKFLREAAQTPNSLHVIYINTSLLTKAYSQEIIPTITCTSSNVVQTILQAFYQIKDLSIFYGPDSYMGQNLAKLFKGLSEASDEEIKQIHAEHNQQTIKELLPRFKYYKDGTCIVHHLFGSDVAKMVQEGYSDAYLTAHFEVPGEMFDLASQASRRGQGTVGSTSNILNFISQKVQEASQRGFQDRLQFILGTESGMVTSIVKNVQQILNEYDTQGNIQVEIVFPTSENAISTSNNNNNKNSNQSQKQVELPTGIKVIPGPASGEGCGVEGGCASCPFMKMNSFQALIDVCQNIGRKDNQLAGFRPQDYEQKIGEDTIAAIGSIPILNMRNFQKDKQIDQNLVQDILSRNQK